jgi:hypothetical protein
MTVVTERALAEFIYRLRSAGLSAVAALALLAAVPTNEPLTYPAAERVLLQQLGLA